MNQPDESLVRIEGQTLPIEAGAFTLDEDDFLLYGMLLDPIYYPELCWKTPTNFDYSGQYRVRDYQYIINRLDDQYAIVSCGRSVGKTVSEMIHAEIHPLKNYDKLLITAPELIHLLPLTDAVEDNIRDSPLLSQFLDVRNQQTGFTHRPFGCNFLDGTKILGRIPRITGVGVKSMHQKDLIVEEGQDYPERGWSEVTEAQPLYAPVLTPAGYVAMGDVEIGSLLVGSDGCPTEVLGIARQGDRQVLRVHFSDGASVDCDAEHLWTVRCNRDVERGVWRTLSTRQIETSLARERGFGSLRMPWFVPRLQPVQMEEQDFRFGVDPYLLGLLLGDGGLRHGSVMFTTADEELAVAVRNLIDPDEELIHSGGYDYRVRRREHGSRWYSPPTRAALMDLGLWGASTHEKHVPKRYLIGSEDQRLALLQGLVDSDGHVTSTGAVSFGSTSPQLADAVAHLAWSLGGTLTRHRYTDRRGYRDMHDVRFRLPRKMVPGRLARKAIASQITTDSMRRRIVRVERLAIEAPMQCVQVAAMDGLYVTSDMVLTHNTINYDSRDRNGKSDFHYWIYGVHSGNKASGFDERARSSLFRKIKVTALRRPDWGRERKENAIASYGGTSSPDYKRNILGEPGAGATAYFVTSRLLACVDQSVTRGDQPGSDYNENLYVKQTFRAEELDDMGMKIGDMLDLPDLKTAGWWGGVDLGLADSPTVISLFAEWRYQKKDRIALMRRFTLERFRPRQIREALYAITWHLGSELLGMGIDVTGLGAPIFQDMEDDELCPPRLKAISAGYVFSSKVEVGVEKDMLTDNQGVLRDHLGNMVKEIVDEITGEITYVVMMPFIAAATRFIGQEVDSGALLLPFDTDVTSDMLQETKQRVERIGQRGETGGGPVRKGDRFHILDSFRAALYRRRQDAILHQLAAPPQESVLEIADEQPQLDYTPQQLSDLLGLGQ